MMNVVKSVWMFFLHRKGNIIMLVTNYGNRKKCYLKRYCTRWAKSMFLCKFMYAKRIEIESK